MPHALRIYRELKAANFSEAQAMCIGCIIEKGRGEPGLFNREAIADELSDCGLGDETSELVADVLQNCFPSQRHKTWFDTSGLKFSLVRSGMTNEVAEALLRVVAPSIITPLTAEIRLPFRHPPGPGVVVMCDFRHLAKPEMQKERRAIVVSTRLASGHQRCTVVPVSKKESTSPNPHHFRIEPGTYPFFHQTIPVWAVCDHVYTVGLDRLWAVNVRLRPQPSARLTDVDFAAVLNRLGTGLGLVN